RRGTDGPPLGMHLFARNRDCGARAAVGRPSCCAPANRRSSVMRQLIAAGPAEQVLEVITPRTNAARLSPAEHVFGAIAVHAATTSAQGDPLLGVLGSMADLPAGWRTIAQLVLLRPARADWARAHQRLALERPLEQDRARGAGPSLVAPLSVLGLLLAYVVGA